MRLKKEKDGEKGRDTVNNVQEQTIEEFFTSVPLSDDSFPSFRYF